MSFEERPVLHALEIEVEAQLRITQSGDANENLALSQTDWLFDPSDVERYRTGLYGLLGAVKAVESDRQSCGDGFEEAGQVAHRASDVVQRVMRRAGRD